MTEVEVSRFIRATRPAVERLLIPEALIEYEGTFTVVDVTEHDDAVTVTARATGMEIPFRFVEHDDGLAYEQETDIGPFEMMRTDVSVEAKDDGVVVTMRSNVSLRLPVPFSSRIAAWKRKGELKRALDRLAADVE